MANPAEPEPCAGLDPEPPADNFGPEGVVFVAVEAVVVAVVEVVVPMVDFLKLCEN